MHKTLSVPALTHRLRAAAESCGKIAPRYHRVAGKIRDGDIPAERDGHQWRVREDDVPAAAALFGLTMPLERSGPETRRKTA